MTAANYQELYVIKSHGARLCGMEVGIVHDQRRILVTGGSRALRFASPSVKSAQPAAIA
jgi:hypothetical protein